MTRQKSSKRISAKQGSKKPKRIQKSKAVQKTSFLDRLKKKKDEKKVIYLTNFENHNSDTKTLIDKELKNQIQLEVSSSDLQDSSGFLFDLESCEIIDDLARKGDGYLISIGHNGTNFVILETFTDLTSFSLETSSNIKKFTKKSIKKYEKVMKTKNSKEKTSNRQKILISKQNFDYKLAKLRDSYKNKKPPQKQLSLTFINKTSGNSIHRLLNESENFDAITKDLKVETIFSYWPSKSYDTKKKISSQNVHDGQVFYCE